MELAIYLLGIMSGIFVTVAATNAFQLRQGKGDQREATSRRAEGYPCRAPRVRRRAVMLRARVRRRAAVPYTPGAARARACRTRRVRRMGVRWHLRPGSMFNYLIWLALISCAALLQRGASAGLPRSRSARVMLATDDDQSGHGDQVGPGR